MDPFKIIVLILVLASAVLQVWQLADFSEKRSAALEALYIIIILALVLTTDFLDFL